MACFILLDANVLIKCKIWSMRLFWVYHIYVGTWAIVGF